MPHRASSSHTSNRGPRVSQGPQSLEVEFGVDLRCAGGSMSKNFSDFTHAGARAKHPRGETVSHQVGPLKVWAQACSVERASNDGRYSRRPSKPGPRCLHANKHPPRFACGTIQAQIRTERFADVDRQGHAVVYQTLAADQDLAGPPIDVMQLQSNDFPGAETEPGKQKKNRVVAAASRSLPVAATHHT